LEGLHYLAQGVRRYPSEVFVGPADKQRLVNRAGANASHIELGFAGQWPDAGSLAFELKIDVGAAPTNRRPEDFPASPEPAFQIRYAVGGEYTGWLGDRPLGYDAHERARFRDLGSEILYRFDARRLAEPSYSDEVIPRLEYDGYGVATVLNHLQTSQPERFAKVVTDLQRVVPSVRSVRSVRTSVPRSRRQTIVIDGKTVVHDIVEALMGQGLRLDFAHASDIDGAHVSAGTLLALGIFTALASLDGPALVLLDDLEQGLHPLAQADLVAALRAILEARPELQIVATSHSPYLVDQCTPDEVVVLAVRQDGSNVCRRLTELPSYERWKESMLPGEFWSFAGKDWVEAP
jgi:hypothetical protein